MKKTTILCLLCVISQYGATQIPDILVSPNQQLVEEAVKEGLVVIRQDYRLQKTIQDSVSFYGRNGKDYFGRAYSLGVKADSGFYTLRNLLKPWETDENYERYRNDTTFKPVIFRTALRSVTMQEYTLSDANWTKGKTNASLTFLPDSINDGFTIDHTFGEKNGWVVLVTSDSNWEETEDSPFTSDIYRTSILTKDDEHAYTIKPPSTTRKILGGIYVCPVVLSVGKISFLLTGMLENDGENWKISIFTENIKTKDYDELNLIQDGG